ncbi:MAG: rRNA maturation RNase YbeY [Deferribacterales bacterium]|nr:rRNA maturation RNase YbeY [Deferribacterales bacterium]
MKLLYTDEVESSFKLEFFNMLVSAVFEKIGVDFDNECEISLLMTDDKSIRELNKDFRNIDKSTDVLSFPMEEETMLGDIAISLETAKRQAESADIHIEREVAFLFIHGVLHLLGYDHETDPESEKGMFDLQEEILKKLVDKGLVQ